MKRFLLLLLAIAASALCVTQCYDDTTLKNDISDLQSRVKTLEDQVKALNGNISTLQTLVNGLNSKVFVNSVTETGDGCVLTFSDGQSAYIRNGKDGADGKDGKDGANGKDGKDGTNGKDGKDGKDGSTPVISVKQNVDGIWYWTLNGQWLKDENGNMMRVTGEPGQPGQPGEPGKDGRDGVTPLLEIQDGYWLLSTNGGLSWEVICKATGEDGTPGAPGKDGDSFFKDVTWDDNYVYVTLADGTGLSLTRGANGVKAIAVVPDVEDGAVLCVLNEFAIRFDVLPKAAADAIVSMDPESLKVNVVYAQTKADLGEELSLPVSSVRGTDGRITVIVDGSALGEDFAIGKIGACASLSIETGSSAVTSGYFPIRYDTERIRKMVEKQWKYNIFVEPDDSHSIYDVGYSFERRLFWRDDTIEEDENPQDCLTGRYNLYQLPNGYIKIFSEARPDILYMFRNVNETTAELAMYYVENPEELYYTQDEFGWFRSWITLTVNENPIQLTWKSMALNLCGKYFELVESTGYGNSSFDEALLHGTEQSLPIVRMHNAGTEEDFEKVDVVGKIAVVDRGEIMFVEKLTNAYFAGAIGVICVNNRPGRVSPGLNGIEPYIDIPLGTVNQEAGKLMSGLSELNFAICTDPNAIQE